MSRLSINHYYISHNNNNFHHKLVLILTILKIPEIIQFIQSIVTTTVIPIIHSTLECSGGSNHFIKRYLYYGRAY